MQLVTGTSLNDYFQDALARATERQQLAASQAATAYVVDLLLSFASHAPPPEALGVRLVECRSAPPSERLLGLREVGDTSLYLTGFFGDALERRLLDVGYYMRLGQDAYRELAGSSRSRKPIFDLYRELGEKFADWVDVIGQVSEEAFVNSPRGVVQLYERWLRTGSERTERTLRAFGYVTRRGEVQ